MSKKITQVGPGVTLKNLISGYRNIFNDPMGAFAGSLSTYLSSRNIYLLNSGQGAFSIILEAIKKLSSKTEVILPAYTAPSMILPILKANLKPVFCDISADDFNMDLNLLSGIITKNTLCIVPTHLFGIPVKGTENLKEIFSEIFIVEDCAQSFGGKINGKHLGCFSDVSFTSFNRGKNLSTYGGGCIFTNSPELSQKIEIEMNSLKEPAAFSKFVLPFKMAAFSLAVTPCIYGVFHPIISKFKDNEIHKEFSMEKYTDFQAGVGISILSKIDEFTEKRHNNGISLINGLSGKKGIRVPCIGKDTKYAFNRLPVLIDNPDLRLKVKDGIWKKGVDTSFMYLKPLHHIYDSGYKKEDFPVANNFAYNLITLPVHPSVNENDIDKMIDVIKKVVI